MHVFYTPDIQSDEYLLNEEESRHCSKVLRLGPGDQVKLIDGKGTRYLAEILRPERKQVCLRVLDRQFYPKPAHYFHLAIAPTKNIDRLEWLLEKATEVGVDEISLLVCERSERKSVKVDRLEKIITAAVKQSLSVYHPRIHDCIPFATFVANAQADQRLIAHCMEEDKKTISACVLPGTSSLVMIGPEGDFSASELRLALEKGFESITLGEKRLRTETAGLVSCFEINHINQ